MMNCRKIIKKISQDKLYALLETSLFDSIYIPDIGEVYLTDVTLDSNSVVHISFVLEYPKVLCDIGNNNIYYELNDNIEYKVSEYMIDLNNIIIKPTYLPC